MKYPDIKFWQMWKQYVYLVCRYSGTHFLELVDLLQLVLHHLDLLLCNGRVLPNLGQDLDGALETDVNSFFVEMILSKPGKYSVLTIQWFIFATYFLKKNRLEIIFLKQPRKPNVLLKCLCYLSTFCANRYYWLNREIDKFCNSSEKKAKSLTRRNSWIIPKVNKSDNTL